MSPDPSKSKGLLDAEFDRRAKAGECKDTLAAEVEALIEWLTETHPEAPCPAPKTVQNYLRHIYSTRARKKA